MTEFYKLHNQIKHYEWGSPSVLPEFLGVEKDEKAWAEMWMGTHPSGPSSTQVGGRKVNLAEVAGGELSFLFKLLAVEKPLSIQAHPNKEQAKEGFHKENRSGLSLDAPDRNYRDANEKPEILCAITPFTVMSGFREPEEIHRSLSAFASFTPELKKTFYPLLRALEAEADIKPLHVFFRNLFDLSKTGRQNIHDFLLEKEICGSDARNAGVISPLQWRLMKNFASQYPDDPAILSPLYLNLFTLEPGQSIFMPAGILHAYISGFGVELMTSSDNVLRGGLTPKHTDIPELMNILKFEPFMPEIKESPSVSNFLYPANTENFSLFYLCGSRMDGGKNSENIFKGNENGPAICVVTEGELHTENLTFKKGESFFIPQSEDGGFPLFKGNYSLFAASGIS